MAVVGRADVVIRALVDRFKTDLNKAFNDAERDADKGGARFGGRFGDAAAKSASKRFIDGLDTAPQDGGKDGDRYGDVWGIEAARTASLRFIDGIDMASVGSKMSEAAKIHGDQYGTVAGGGATRRFIEGLDTSPIADAMGRQGHRGGVSFGEAASISGPKSFIEGIDMSPVVVAFGGGGDRAGREFHDNAIRWFGAVTGEAGDGGDNAGNAFASAWQHHVNRINVDMPNFGGRLALKFLAIIPIIGILGGALSSLVGGLFAVGAAAAQAAPALSIFGAAAVGLIGTVLAGVVAFGGIGDAVKALGEEQASAGKTALAAGKQQRAAARQVESAERQLRNAHERVADAQRNLTKAQRDLTKARTEGSRDQARAARAVADAEENLTDAQRDQARAQDDLTKARVDAKEKLEDLALSLRGAVLGEEEAVLRLRRARQQYVETLNDPNATSDDRAQARLDLEQAELALDQAKDRREDVTKQTQEANKAGIEGSNEVVRAKERIADADERVADSEQALADARIRQNEARIASDERVAAAQERIADAQRGLRDANEGVADAVKDLAEAQRSNTEAMKATSAAADKTAKALAGLSPSARKFAQLIVDMKPQFQELRHAVQEPLFEHLIPIMGQLSEGLFPTLNRVLAGTGDALGKTAQKLADTFTNTTFLSNFEGIMKQNESTIVHMGGAVGNLARGFAAIFDAAGPVIEIFAAWIEKTTGAWASSKEFSNETGTLTNKIMGAADVAKRLGDVLGTTWDIIKGLAKAAAPAGDALLRSFQAFLDKKNEFVNSGPGQERLKEYFDNLVPVVTSVSKFVGELSKQFMLLGEDRSGKLAETIDTLTTGLEPLRKGIEAFTDENGPLLADTIVKIVDAFGALAESNAFEYAIQIIGLFADTIKNTLGAPVIGPILLGILGLLGAFKALRAIGKFTGLTSLKNLLVGGLFGDERSHAKGTQSLILGLRGVEQESTNIANLLGNKVHHAFSGTKSDLELAALEAKEFAKSLELPKDINTTLTDLNKFSDMVDKLGANLGRIDPDRFLRFSELHPEAAERLQVAVMKVADELARLDVEKLGDIEKFNAGNVEAAKTALDELSQTLKTMPDAEIAFGSTEGRIKNLKSALQDVGTDARKYGEQISDDLADGIKAGRGRVDNAVDDVADEVADYLEQNSPAKRGPLSRGGGSFGWGKEVSQLFAAGIRNGAGAVTSAANTVANKAGDGLENVKTRGKNVGAAIGRAKGGGANVAQSFFSDLTSGNVTSVKTAAASISSAFANELQNAGEDALMGVGTKVMSGFGDEAAEAGGDAATKTAGRFSKISGKFAKIGGGLAKAARGIGAAMSVALGPVGLIIIGIGLLVAGLIYAYKHSETFRKIVDGAMKGIAKAFSAMWDVVKKVFKFLKDHIEIVLLALGPLGWAIAGIVTVFKNWDKIKQIVGDVVGAVIGFFRDLPGKIKGFVEGAASWLTTKFTGIRDMMRTKVREAVDGVVTFFRELPGRIGAFVGNVVSKAGELGTKIGNAIKDKAKAGFDGIVDFFKNLPGRIGGFIKGIGDKAAEAGKALWDGLKRGLVNAVVAVGGLEIKLANMLIGLINKFIINKINDALEFDIKLGRFGPSYHVDVKNIANIPEIPGAAKGATVLPRPGGTLLRVGEAGRAESIVDTGLLNARLDADADLNSNIRAELARQTELLRIIAANAGFSIDNFTLNALPEEGIAQSVPRVLRDLSYQLGS